MAYGNIAPNGAPRDLIGEVTRSMAGNVILRVGRENEVGWERTAHITLTPEEARALSIEIGLLALSEQETDALKMFAVSGEQIDAALANLNV